MAITHRKLNRHKWKIATLATGTAVIFTVAYTAMGLSASEAALATLAVMVVTYIQRKL